jgi:CRISPR-associated protein Cas1
MPVLYVVEQGAQVRYSKKRFLVVKDKEVLQVVRERDLERVVLVGHVQLTANAIAAILNIGIDTTFLTLKGRYKGRLSPVESKNVFLRIAQFRRYEDMGFRLSMARSIIAAKIANARRLILAHARNHPDKIWEQPIEALSTAEQKANSAETLASLMGIEGDSARVYFETFGKMLRRELQFEQRSRRPPRDPVNALLSFGYTLVLSEIIGAVASQGLDPYVGFLHELDYGRPSLGLDILEEFRQPLVDRFVLSLVNRGVFSADEFERRENGGVYLKDEPRKKFLRFYERAMTSEFRDRTDGGKVTFRELIRRQATRMSQAIQTGGGYDPYRG